MLYSQFKWFNLSKFVLIIVFLGFLSSTTVTTDAVAKADWGDVVDVIYQRYDTADYQDPPAENGPINYIYLTTDQEVPRDILAMYPSASAGLILGFKNGIIGLVENQEKEFRTEDVYDGEGWLYFRVTLTKIWYDASSDDGSTTSLTTTTSRSPVGIDYLAVLGGGIVIISVSMLFWGYSNQKRRQKILDQDNVSEIHRKQAIKQKKTRLKELRELTESHSPSSELEKPDKSNVTFKRRR